MNKLKTIIKNIGKIVILLFQIVYEQIKWYIDSWNRVKRYPNGPSHSNNKRVSILNEERTTRSDTKTKDDITFI